MDGSAKLRRLTEIVDEAAAGGRKVVVFSFFRDVLSVVARVLGNEVPDALMVGRRGRPEHPGRLGGDHRRAQLTPTIEEQAIARAHRMGQVRRVDVHRLLCENSVDQRMLELLHGKRVAFDQYARRSDLAEATPDAVDISDLAAAGKAATDVELQRRIVEAEQRRLRSDGA